MKRKILIFVLFIITVCAFTQAPEWIWAEEAGGSSFDEGSAITIDDNGNSYVTGRFMDTATFGSYSLICTEGSDIFVAKMDADGNWLWATKADGTYYNRGYGITIDNDGNSYVTGYFEGTVTFGSYSLTGSGDHDIFIAKIDANGNWLWAIQAGGSGGDGGYGIKIDNAGNSYVTGCFYDTATFGSYFLTSNGSCDIFVAKIDANGNWLWVSKAGGNDVDGGYGITIDITGNSYVTGGFRDTATFGSYSLTSSGYCDIFVAKMDANGNWLWVTKAGGFDYEGGSGITIDTAWNSYVIGTFCETATFGSYSLTSSGLFDVFVAKMNANGNWLWATQAGGTDWDLGDSITIDSAGNSYVTGYFYETVIFGSHSLISSGYSDIFVAKIDANGNWLWAIQAGGFDYDYGSSITIDDAGNSYVTGKFMGIATFGSHSLTSSGGEDIFVAKLNSSVSAENEIIPAVNSLSNYPNPFNPSTTISFNLTTEFTEDTELVIYNLKGQKVRTFSCHPELVEGSINWNGTDESGKPASSGIYFYKLKSGNFEVSRKMLLIK